MKTATRRMVRAALALVLLLAGCGTALQTAAPDGAAVAPTVNVTATATVVVKKTPQPTAAPTVAAPTPQPIPSQQSWPVCFELLPDAALRAQVDDLWASGDYDVLAKLLNERRAILAQPDAALDIALARTLLADEDLAGGAALLLPWAQAAGPLQHEALALLQHAYEQAREWRGAATTGELLLALAPPGATFVAWQTALDWVQLEEPLRALELLNDLDVSALPPGDRAEMLEETARLAREQNQWELALASLDEILSFAVQPVYRALIKVERARTLMTISEFDEAIATINDVLSTQGDGVAGQRAVALLTEIAALNPDMEAAKVPPLVSARALLYEGQNEGVLDAVKVALKARDVDRAEAYAVKGLALAAQGSPRTAMAEFDRAITIYAQRQLPTDEQGLRRMSQVWFAKAEAVAALNGDARKTYALFASRHPSHPDAPRALLLKAQLEQEAGETATASDSYAKLVASYPRSAEAPDAALWAGLLRYQEGQFAPAQAAWATALTQLQGGEGEIMATAEELARLETWVGLARRAGGDLAGAKESWQAATARDPDGYWGQRADDLSEGVTLGLPLQSAALPAAPPTDWATIDAWVAPWAGAPLPEADTALVRAGVWLWRVGWEAQAVDLLAGLANQRRDEAFLLALIGRDGEAAGIWQVSTLAAERLLQAGQGAGASEPPEDLWRVAYPLAYAALVQENAARYGLDPLLLEAVLRQESRFYARAVSGAGARGLAQVMPSTGAWIAEKIGPDDYGDALLFRPLESIRYGSWYLDYGLSIQARNWPVALVAYNAGPGNLDSWTGGEPVTDDDLFIATLPADEPQDYVIGVYRQYRLYERLYR